MSTVQFDTWKDSAGTREFQGATAWVRFDGTGTPSILNSHNVDSITDNATGNYSVNFTNALDGSTYTAVATTAGTAASNTVDTLATTSLRLRVWDSSNTLADSASICCVVLGGI